MSHLGVFQTMPRGADPRPDSGDEDYWERVSVFLVLPPAVNGETQEGEVIDISEWDITPDKGDFLTIQGRVYTLPVPRWVCRGDGSRPECWFYLNVIDSVRDVQA